MMSIEVEWLSERGELLARYEGPSIDEFLPQRAAAGSCCLRFIDPFGDTTFNFMQVQASRRNS